MADEPSAFQGTLRVETTANGVVASADLYARPEPVGTGEDVLGPPDPAAGIPIFPIADYQCYLRITGVDQSAEGVTLTMEKAPLPQAGRQVHRRHRAMVARVDLHPCC